MPRALFIIILLFTLAIGFDLARFAESEEATEDAPPASFLYYSYDFDSLATHSINFEVNETERNRLWIELNHVLCPQDSWGNFELYDKERDTVINGQLIEQVYKDEKQLYYLFTGLEYKEYILGFKDVFGRTLKKNIRITNENTNLEYV